MVSHSSCLVLYVSMCSNVSEDNKLEENNQSVVKAIQENDEEKVKSLVASENVNQFTEDYWFHAKVPLLFIASKLGRANIVKLLLQKGAEIDAVDSLGRTALQAACEENFEDVVDILLTKNADPNVKRFDEHRTPNNTPLGCAIKTGNMSTIEKLLKAGAHVNLYDMPSRKSCLSDGKVVTNGNYLHSSLGQSNPDIVKVLCKHGCDVDFRDENGETPLFLAVRLVDIESAKILLEHGASSNVVTDQGNTLNIAAATVPVNKDMIKLLVENGAQLNVREKMKRIPLALYLNNYSMNEDISVVKYLIQHGTILNDTCMINEIKWMLNRLGGFEVVKVAIEGGMNIHNLSWLRNFLGSPPGRKYWYSSMNYDVEKEKEFRKYAEPIISKPYSLAKLCAFSIRNELMFLSSGDSIYKDIEKLPLPEQVKQYLFLEHL